MAAILNQARRHCFSRTAPSRFSLLIRSHSSPNPSFSSLHRSLCSSSSDSSSSPPQSTPEETQFNNPSPRPPILQVQPVSYPVKPKDPSPPQDESPLPRRRPDQVYPGPGSSVNAESEPPTWTREDIRYVRDFPPVSAVTYPTRVAPLPEDRPANDVNEESNEQLEAERRRIEADNRVIRRPFRVDSEPKVPFPTLIKGDQSKRKVKVVHDLKEAIRLVKVNAKANFIETLEAHVKLTPDLRRTDLKLAGSVSLPHGAGKSLRIAVFAEGAHADEARAAGADLVGGEELIEQIKNGTVKVNDIDKCITTPQMMPRVGKQISKKLNRLTPNAKDGSVTTDISRAVKESKQKTDFKKDKTAIVHIGLGKVNLTDEALCENVGAFVNALLLAKPAGLKKSSKYAGYVNSFYICSSMGPSYPVSIQSLSIAADRYSKLQVR